jgi:elongation factor Ts
MDNVSELGKNICMHIAASNPIAISSDEISEEVIEKEKQIAIDQAREAKKPENIIEKMVEGRIRKFTEENALLSQVFVIDNETKISQLLENKSKEMNSPIKVTKFIRMELGEGIEKKDEDFASEVAAVVNKK